jgi:hypothetical protein
MIYRHPFIETQFIKQPLLQLGLLSRFPAGRSTNGQSIGRPCCAIEISLMTQHVALVA